MNQSNEYRPKLIWRKTWPDKQRDFTAKPPERKDAVLRMYWEYAPNGGSQWFWVANDWCLIDKGITRRSIDAVRYAEEAYFRFLEENGPDMSA